MTGCAVAIAFCGDRELYGSTRTVLAHLVGVPSESGDTLLLRRRRLSPECPFPGGERSGRGEKLRRHKKIRRLPKAILYYPKMGGG